MISLGGLDDGRLVVWNIEKRFALHKRSPKMHNYSLNVVCFRMAICGAVARNEVTGTANGLCALQKFGNIFLTCGERKFKYLHSIFGHMDIKNKFRI